MWICDLHVINNILHAWRQLSVAKHQRQFEQFEFGWSDNTLCGSVCRVNWFDKVTWHTTKYALHLTHPRCTHTAVKTHTHTVNKNNSTFQFMERIKPEIKEIIIFAEVLFMLSLSTFYYASYSALRKYSNIYSLNIFHILCCCLKLNCFKLLFSHQSTLHTP